MSFLFIDRIWAVMLRHLLLQFRDMYRLINLLFWPFFDVVIWSFMSVMMFQANSSFVPVIGAFFWQATSRTSCDISSSFMDELFSKNITNLFSSPMNFLEYVTALSLITVLRVIAILVLCGTTIFWITGINVLMFGWLLAPILLSLFISGMIMALFSCALLFRWGMRAVEFIWVIAWCSSAFVGVFYPISILPNAMQYIGKMLPMAYALNAVHSFGISHRVVLENIAMSFALNALYGVLGIYVLHASYKAACAKGLARLEAD